MKDSLILAIIVLLSALSGVVIYRGMFFQHDNDIIDSLRNNQTIMYGDLVNIQREIDIIVSPSQKPANKFMNMGNM